MPPTHPFPPRTAPNAPQGETAPACDRQDRWDEDDDEDEPALDMRDADVAQLEDLQAMAMTFAKWLHGQGAQQMESGGDKAAGEIRQLSHSFNRAARAVRQIVVLKHEVAELRPLPGSRSAAPANQNVRPSSGNARHDRYFQRQRERSDLDDYTDEERHAAEVEANAWLEKVVAALQVDIEAAGPEVVAHAAGQSIATKLSTIAAGIPHPTLDACLAEIEIRKLWNIFAPKYARNRAQGPPPIGGWPDDSEIPTP
jgi:hypothetical protein